MLYQKKQKTIKELTMILQDNFLKIKSKMHNVVKGFISLSKPEE